MLAPAPDPARVAWLKGCEYAHRGLHGAGRVENSRAAFVAAIEAGMGIECDIQRSRDDQPMVFHDWDFARLLGRSDQGADLAAADWRALRYADGEAPMSLPELLDLLAGRVALLIEIKSRRGYDVALSCRRVVEALRGYWKRLSTRPAFLAALAAQERAGVEQGSGEPALYLRTG